VDIPTRYGKGYLILLPMTNETGARTVRERLLAIFEKEFETKEGKSVKFSLQIGVASHNGGPTLMKEKLLKTAKLNLQ
jgi:GGDEF domain-containing protein